MKNIFTPINLVVAGSLTLSGCTSSMEEQIKMPVMLSVAVVKAGVEYIKRSSTGVFAISSDGKSYAYEICDSYSDEYAECLERNKSKIVEKCEEEHNKECNLVAVNDKIVYPGEVNILNKKFYKGDRINYFTVPALRDVDDYMETQQVDLDALPDIFDDVYE